MKISLQCKCLCACRACDGMLCVWNKDGGGAKELEGLHSEKLKVVQLDVCSEEQVSQALQFVTANLDDPEKGEGWEFKGHSGGP